MKRQIKVKFQGAFLSNSKNFAVILMYFCKFICGLFFCFVLLCSEALNSYLFCGNTESSLSYFVCHGSNQNITDQMRTGAVYSSSCRREHKAAA